MKALDHNDAEIRILRSVLEYQELPLVRLQKITIYNNKNHIMIDSKTNHYNNNNNNNYYYYYYYYYCYYYYQ